MKASLGLLAFASSFILPTRALIYEHESKLKTPTYDYIIVGGGTAGAVLANRLSENSTVSVLVIEAGGSHEDVMATKVPLLVPTLFPNTPWDWNYTTTPQPGFNGRAFPYTRGFLLGGSSSINAMVYNRGSRDDYDAYARIAEDKRWSWESISKGPALENEGFIAPSGHRGMNGSYLPSAHTGTGMLPVSLPSTPNLLDSRVIAASLAWPKEYPFQHDVNDGNTIGVGWAPASIGNGQRSSAATSYLAPRYLSRPNLSVLLHTRATKLVQTGTSSGKPHFGAVEIAAGPLSPVKRVRARREVIVSAGSVNTPQLLMLSGLGDRRELSAAGIKTIVHLPSVGKNGSDHVGVSTPFRVNSNDTFNKYLLPENVNAEVSKWNKTHEGPLSWSLTRQIAWQRLPAKDPVLAKHGDPSAGPTAAHFQLHFVNGVISATKVEGSYNTIFTGLATSASRGNITLNTTNPFDAPVVNPNFISTEVDMHILVEALKSGRKFIESPAFKGYFQGYDKPAASLKTDADFTKYIRDNAYSIYHLVGTAGMTARGAKYGVVDPDFRVKGTSGLRIVDASVIPFVPSAQVQGPVYLIAELAGTIIKGDN